MIEVSTPTLMSLVWREMIRTPISGRQQGSAAPVSAAWNQEPAPGSWPISGRIKCGRGPGPMKADGAGDGNGGRRRRARRPMITKSPLRRPNVDAKALRGFPRRG